MKEDTLELMFMILALILIITAIIILIIYVCPLPIENIDTNPLTDGII